MTAAITKLAGLVPDHLAPRARKIVLEDYCLMVDIGFHEFEIGSPQRLFVTVEVWVEPSFFAAEDEQASAWDYDFLRTEIQRLAEGRRFNLQETLCSAILDLCLAQKGVLGAVVQTDKPDVYPGVATVACRMARMRPALATLRNVRVPG